MAVKWCISLCVANLPVYYRCLAFPVRWEIGASPKTGKHSNLALLASLGRAREQERDPDLLKVNPLYHEKPAFFDPKQKRNEFFRLKRGDVAGLIGFLNTVGLFQSAMFIEEGNAETAITKLAEGDHHSVHYEPLQSANQVWDLRDLLLRSLSNRKSEFGRVCDFQTRILRERSSPRVVITTTTLLDAVLLSILIDRVKKTRVQKCARPDCGILFTPNTRHVKKYCSRYCAHIESVRRDRERKKQQAARNAKGKPHVDLQAR